ncbi:MAG: transposase family protein [Victivallaceae bacterium]|nr:transposase family protein [Victivallaceae bacterium]
MKKLNPEACEILRAEELPDELKIHEKSLPAKTVARRVGTEGMRSLFTAFKKLPGVRRGEGKRYSIPCCFSIILCAVLASCKGVRECTEFTENLSQPQLRALKSWRNKKTGKFTAPPATTFGRVAEAMEPVAFKVIKLRVFYTYTSCPAFGGNRSNW